MFTTVESAVTGREDRYLLPRLSLGDCSTVSLGTTGGKETYSAGAAVHRLWKELKMRRKCRELVEQPGNRRIGILSLEEGWGGG